MSKSYNILSLFDGVSCAKLALDRAGIGVNQYFASEIDKYAIQVSKKNWPGITQLGDVTKISVESLPQIDLIMGGSPCFPENTQIITRNSFKNIQDVKAGDEVLTHENRYRKVLNTGGKKNQNLILIKAQGLKPTEVTKEHPFYVRSMTWKSFKRTTYRSFSEPFWKKAEDLKKGDFLGIPISKVESNDLNLTDEEAFILGRYIADGHTAKNYRVSENRPNDRHWQMVLSAGSHKLEEFTKQIKETPFYSHPHTKSVHRVIFSSKRLVQIAEEHCGCGAVNKRISKTLLDLPVEKLKRLLEGIMSGDGHFREERGSWKITTVSEQLVMSLSVAALKVYGTVASYEFTERPKTTVIEGRTVNQRDTYVASFSISYRKQSNYVVIDGFAWVPIKSVTYLDYKKDVFNLEVEEDNSYTANGVIVHNCQSHSSAGKHGGFNDPRGQLFFDALRILREIQAKNSNVKFLFENVKMKKESADLISKELGVEPITINSSLLSAQNRVRMYWSNIPNLSQPEDAGIKLQDVIESGYVDREKAYCIDANYFKGGNPTQYFDKSRRQLVFKDKDQLSKYAQERIDERKVDKTGVAYNWYNDKIINDKSPALTSNPGCWSAAGGVVVLENPYRKLSVEECEILQNLPKGYTSGISDTQRYKCVGNGWTVDAIAHLLKGFC